MSKVLADKLINAQSAGAFLLEPGVAATWETVSALKAEVDRLIGSDLNAAERLSERVEQVAAALGDPTATAFAEVSRARVLHHLGRYAEADALYQNAMEGTRAAGLATDTAVIQMHRVFALTQMSRYDEALAVSRKSRRVLSPDAPVELAQLETNVGILYYRLDRYAKAIEHYERARAILASAGDDTMRAVVDTNLSHALMETDRHGDALRLLEGAAAAMERSGQTLWAAQTRFHIGYLQFLRGNYNAALTTHYQAREELARLGSPQLVAWCDHEVAEILLALNAFDDAAESAALARASFTSLGLSYESGQAAVVHALAAMGQQEFDQAERDFLDARRVFADNSNTTLVALIDSYLAELCLRRGNPAEAGQHAASSLRVFARQKLSTRAAYARLLSARAAYESGDLKRAVRAARAALESIGDLSVPAVAYQSHHLIGRIERDRKRGALALQSFRRAVEIIEKMRGGIAADEFKATFLHDKIHAYEDAIAACLDHGGEELIDEAFRLVESSKSRALADLLARYVRGSADSEAQDGLTAEGRQRLSRLIEDLNWYGSQAGIAEDKGDQRSAEVANRYRHSVARCERQIAQLFRRMETEAPAFADIQQMKGASLADLRETLQPGETVIEYFTTGKHISAFIASREGIQIARRIAAQSEVEKLLATLRFQIEKFNYGPEYVEAYFGQLRRAANEILGQLYLLVLAPLEAMLDGKRLIVIPHGALHYVPFHALHDGNGYLIERFEISYAPSAAVLKLCRTRHAAGQIPDLKDKTSSGDVLVALGVGEAGTPNIEQEIEALAALFPNSVKLTGDRATRENLVEAAPRARFLHLASHGYFRRDNPMFSFLKLAGSKLHFYSLLDLKLSAEMVTLSACHTGVNKVFPGDELHGLVRGFLYAGAPSVVASLWAVSDLSTADLMREMYSHLRDGATKRAALRRAQLAIKDAYGHPYYWAPFVLMGNPE
ncbi:MAG TPA: CHAT domain-containing tetratricopeptide repeat protein [Blastocatellia bacterium]|nr:CHAT domain-containing tetratricopeptide repeat protein [Blastocatellia bacterium]